MTGGVHYSRIKLSGVGTATQDSNSLNVFDDRLPQPGHQQYLWFDYSSRLSAIPAGQNIVEATLEWSGRNQLFAGASGLNTVTTPVGVFPQPNDGNRGIPTIAAGADGMDLVDFYAGTTPAASVSVEQGETKNFVWNVTQLVKDWQAAPAAGNYGKFLLVPGAHPSWIAWDQNRIGPKLTIRTQASPIAVTALGYMTPSPNAANTGVTAAGPLLREVTENPAQPPPATAVSGHRPHHPLSGWGHYRGQPDLSQALRSGGHRGHGGRRDQRRRHQWRWHLHRPDPGGSIGRRSDDPLESHGHRCRQLPDQDAALSLDQSIRRSISEPSPSTRPSPPPS